MKANEDEIKKALKQLDNDFAGVKPKDKEKALWILLRLAYA